MTIAKALAILAAGTAAGGINTLVGSGTLITFPLLLTFGFAPVTANISNNVGLVPGALAGAVAYRREMTGQWPRALRLGSASLLGGATGAGALLLLPASSFEAIVPFFIGLAILMVAFGPRINRAVATRHGTHPDDTELGHAIGVWLAIYATGFYGGYFGAAQGVLLLGVLGLAMAENLHRINALKIILATIVNSVAAIIFMLVADVNWVVVGLIAIGSMIGGGIAGRYGRHLPVAALRGLIIVVGIVGIVSLLMR
ncbi:MAG: TSUP family transporter [Actinobacteria bacterium]|nr:TSUP family transporter [Actinomycetota bacterium]